MSKLFFQLNVYVKTILQPKEQRYGLNGQGLTFQSLRHSFKLSLRLYMIYMHVYLICHLSFQGINITVFHLGL